MLLETFRIEAEERLGNISHALFELEKEELPEKQEGLIEATFREFHSLKGAARSVNLSSVEKICQAAESVFSRLKSKQLQITDVILDEIIKCVDCIKDLMNPEKHYLQSEMSARALKLSVRLEQAARGEFLEKDVAEDLPVENSEESENEKYTSTDSTVRISIVTLDLLMQQVEELRSIKLMEKDQGIEVKKILDDFEAIRKILLKNKVNIRSVRSAIKKSNSDSANVYIPQVSTIFDIHEQSETLIKTLAHKVKLISDKAEHNYRAIESQIEGLTQDMKKVMMMPFSLLLQSFPMIVRDLSRHQEKQVELVIEGDNIETDRRILDELKYPLIHLVRNCIDHGIETPAIRLKKGKPAQAKIKISISQIDSSTAEVLISDDGSGIDIEKLRNTVRNKISDADINVDEYTEKELLPFIFYSGISTKQDITAISGRGLGLAIVREKTEGLGGTISLSTEKDKGTTFKIQLPFNLASFHGVEVIIAGQNYLLPTIYVERVLAIPKEQVVSLENRQAIDVEGKAVSLMPLAQILGIENNTSNANNDDKLSVVVLKTAGRRIAFLIDKIVGEQEVLVKKLGSQLKVVRNILGATILGNGKIVPVLNVPDILNFSENTSFTIHNLFNPQEVMSTSKKRINIMVAEDSITSRMMLKNILESAGYNVTTAIDGLDAYEQLASGGYDLVVSDVDMPRMSGFTLTEKVRGDKRFSDLPVILVTALESKEDRERGIDVGANAYVVKRSFDQSNLLDIIKKII